MPRPSFEDLDHPGYPDDTGQLMVFFDTEFTELSADARLISIGLVSKDGSREFYAELSDTWRPEHCLGNPVVLEAALPQLEGDSVRLSMDELTRQLRTWLEAFGQPVVLATDSVTWDWPWIHEVFGIPGTWPANLACKPLLLQFEAERGERFANAIETAFAGGLRRHHALDDAKANRLGWLAAVGTER